MSNAPTVGMPPATLAERVQALRDSALFDDDGPALTGAAEQFYLLAIAALEAAQRFATLADGVKP